MIRFAKVSRMLSNILAEIKGLGGTTQNRVINIKGLYSKAQNENALIIPLADGNNQDVVFVLQKEIDLENGDVYLTDDKSYIHFRFSSNTIELKSENIILNSSAFKVNAKSVDFNVDAFKVNAKSVDFNVDTFKVNAKSVDFNNCSVKNDGTSIDNTHVHAQNSGNHYGGGTNTSAPM